MATLHYTGLLTTVKCWCGINHAIPEELHASAIRHRDEHLPALKIHCPLGHAWVVGGKSEVDRQKELVERERQRMARERASHDQTRAELRETERRRIAQKAATTRIKKRLDAGVCPCCNRTFQDLAQHMHQQHPEFVDADDVLT